MILINMLMIWQISFRSENHKAYTVTNTKIAVSNGDGKEIQDQDKIKHPCRPNIAFIKYFDGKEISNSIKEPKQISKKFTGNNQVRYRRHLKEHNPNFHPISGHPYRILKISSCGCRKTNALLNLIDYQPDIDKYTWTQKIPMNQSINC